MTVTLLAFVLAIPGGDETIDTTTETLATAETTVTTEDGGLVELGPDGEPVYDNALDEPLDEHDVENYLAAKFASSRDKFESPTLVGSPSLLESSDLPESKDFVDSRDLAGSPDADNLDQTVYDEISEVHSNGSVGNVRSRRSLKKIPIQGEEYERLGPSLTKVRSNTGSYMTMDRSNSSRLPISFERNRSNFTNPNEPRHFVHKHPFPSPEYGGARPKTPLVIDMAHCFSPERAPIYPRHSSPKRRRPRRHRREHAESHERQRLLPEQWRVRPVIGGIQVSTENPKRSPDKKHRSPQRRVSPIKTSFKSGISYNCNHALE